MPVRGVGVFFWVVWCTNRVLLCVCGSAEVDNRLWLCVFLKNFEFKKSVSICIDTFLSLQ